MVTVRLARMAMACRFELVLQGEHEPWLRAAGEEALREIDRMEQLLSIFRSDSDVSRINARAAREPVRVTPSVFRWLEEAQRLYRQTDGAFDLTIAPLMQAWGFYDEGGHLPDKAELESARRRTGMHLVELDPTNRTISFRREGVRLDFGAIGKGLAVDEAASILREAGVERAFLHGGTSTMYGLGRPVDEPGWKVVVPYPGRPDEPVCFVSLVDESLSVSAIWGKSFEAEGRTLGHVLDPTKGRPVQGAVLAAVAASSGTVADAVSTALLVHGRPTENTTIRSLVIGADDSGSFSVIDAGLSANDHAVTHSAHP